MPAASDSPSYLLFDLDETLYPSSSGLVEEISRRMTVFVARFLKLGEQEAARLRSRLSREYGTTLTGLIREYRFTDSDAYLEFTHPADVERYLHKDPRLAPALASIPLPKSILTNSPKEHALRILEFLEVRQLFERIFDIRFNDLRVKPERAVYQRVLAELGRRPGQVLFIDDRLDYLLGFREIGGRVLLVAERERGGQAPPDVPWIQDIKELPAYISRLRRR